MSCYGQTIKSYRDLEVIEYDRVTTFKIEGMMNREISEMLHLWFVTGFLLALFAAMI